MQLQAAKVGIKTIKKGCFDDLFPFLGCGLVLCFYFVKQDYDFI